MLTPEGFLTLKTLICPYPWPLVRVRFLNGKGIGQDEDTYGLPTPITIHCEEHQNVQKQIQPPGVFNLSLINPNCQFLLLFMLSTLELSWVSCSFFGVFVSGRGGRRKVRGVFWTRGRLTSIWFQKISDLKKPASITLPVMVIIHSINIQQCHPRICSILGSSMSLSTLPWLKSLFLQAYVSVEVYLPPTSGPLQAGILHCKTTDAQLALLMEVVVPMCIHAAPAPVPSAASSTPTMPFSSRMAGNDTWSFLQGLQNWYKSTKT